MTHGTALTPEHYGLLAKERIIAKPGFNRWLVPPAALAIHLCIGMAYGFSVFWLPLSHAIGINEPVACAADISFFQRIFSASCDWRVSELTWMYTLFFVQGRRGRGVLLVGRVGDFRAWRALASDLDAVDRLGRDRRHWPRAWLYLPGLNPGQMVP